MVPQTPQVPAEGCTEEPGLLGMTLGQIMMRCGSCEGPSIENNQEVPGRYGKGMEDDGGMVHTMDPA